MKNLLRINKFWAAVKVKRGFPEEVIVFTKEKSAIDKEKKWREDMNLDYDDTGVFEIKSSDIVTDS